MKRVMLWIAAALCIGGCGTQDLEPREEARRRTSPAQVLRETPREEILNFEGDVSAVGTPMPSASTVSQFSTAPHGWAAPPVVNNAGFDTIVRGVAPGWNTPAGDPFCTWLDYIIAWKLGEHGTGAITTSMPQCGVTSEVVSVPPGYGAYLVKARYLMENVGTEGSGVVSVQAEWLNEYGTPVGQMWGGGFPSEPCIENPDGTYYCPPGPLGVWRTASLLTAKPSNATRFRMRLVHTSNWGGDLTVDWVKVVWMPPNFPTCLTDDSLIGKPRADVIACAGAPCTSTVSGTTELLSYCFSGCGQATCTDAGFVKVVNGYVKDVTFYTPPT